MRNSMRRILMVGLLLIASASSATSSFYAGKVQVENVGTEARDLALKDILEQVLIRMTGAQRAADIPQIDQLLPRATAWVESFNYERIEPPTDNPRARWLHANFNAQALKQALKELEIPVWPARRPVVLMWVGYDDGLERSIINADSHPEVASYITETAESRGMRVQFPLLDLEEQLSISVTDIWGNFTDTINQASSRYNPDVVAAVKIRRVVGSKWMADWSYINGDTPTWATESTNVESLASSGVHRLLDILRKQYASVTTAVASDAFTIRFNGIDSYPNYDALTSTLRKQPRIKSVHVAQVTDGSVTLNVDAEWSRVELISWLDRVPTLRPLEQLDGSTVLVYELR